jgi:hypothetical protein
MIYYADSYHCQWTLQQIGILSPIRDIDEFVAYPDQKMALFHIPFPYDQDHGEAFETRLDKILNCCDKIAVIGSELHESTVDFVKRYQKDNIKYFLCGFIEGIDTNCWMDWFATSTAFYKQVSILDSLTPYKVKPKVFDILLGGPREHRTVIYDYIKQSNFNDRVIMTYLRDYTTSLQQSDLSNWIWPDGLEIPADNLRRTVTPVMYHGHWLTLSQVVPINVYNQTAYTVVAETNYANHYSFYTEKIVKPILAERLFLVVSGRHYLRNLHKLGFKTFDGIIDESYDNIDNTAERYSKVCDQIRFLCSQPQEDILNKIRPITEHNKQVMLTTDWQGSTFKSLQEFLLAHAEQN